MKAVRFALALAVAAGSAGAAVAEELKVEERFSGTTVAFDLEGTFSNVTVTVIGPDDYWLSAASEKGAPTLDIRKGGTLSDGLYTYQLSAATSEAKKVVREYLDDGRDRGATPQLPASTSGSFVVQKGSIVKFDPTATER